MCFKCHWYSSTTLAYHKDNPYRALPIGSNAGRWVKYKSVPVLVLLDPLLFICAYSSEVKVVS